MNNLGFGDCHQARVTLKIQGWKNKLHFYISLLKAIDKDSVAVLLKLSSNNNINKRIVL